MCFLSLYSLKLRKFVIDEGWVIFGLFQILPKYYQVIFSPVQLYISYISV